MKFENTLEFAKSLDQQDELSSFRDKFYIPIVHEKEAIYLTGNSLGLQPKTVQDYVTNELEDWANFGVEGHFEGRIPWLHYHEIFPEKLSKLTGALPEELVVMNQLTVNLHLLLTTFYRPTKEKYKIICEAKAFPSDQYAFESQVKFHGFLPDEAIIEVAPRDGEHNLKTEDIIDAIWKNKDSLALVIFSGVNYYTGQVYDMPAITKAAHDIGVHCGFDLAHAVGNIELKLHEWNVDFACWCSYKYLNSGPGGVAGVYINKKHATDTTLPRMAGWWGHDKNTRFKMEKGFHPIDTAEGWQLSNAPVLSMAAHHAALNIFEEAGFKKLLQKAKMLSDYLFFILENINAASSEKLIEIITPKKDKGCQVSILMLKNGKEVFKILKEHSVIADWREPDVIRVAFVPLYNTFKDIFMFGEILKRSLRVV
ncbi:kynureninase [soil metagenome]